MGVTRTAGWGFLLAALVVTLHSGLAGAAGQQRGSAASVEAANAPSSEQALLTRYCFTCHNQRLKTAGLALDTLDAARPGDHSEIWEKVIRKLRVGVMPPAGRPRPDKAAYEALITWLETALDRAAAERPNPGRTESLHRLNRIEYANAIRDVLHLEAIDVAYLLPPDEASYGFDNIAGVLGMSPTHLERYLSAARKIGRLAVGDPTLLPDVETYSPAGDLTQKDRFENLPFGSRGGMLIRRHIPLDAEYLLKFETGVGKGAAAKEPQYAEVSVDGQRVRLIRLDAEAVGQGGYSRQTRFLHEIPLVMNAGVREIAVTFVKTSNAEVENLLQPFERSESILVGRDGAEESGPALFKLSISGPFNAAGVSDTPSRRRIFVCYPASRTEELSCARDIITTLARRGYRRPPTGHEITTLLRHYENGRTDGTFDTGIQRAIERFLSSPAFLFRVVEDPPGVPPGSNYHLSDLDLASRLSFFLWSSVPDDELLDAAIKGQLKDPAVLERQTKRMLADPKNTLVSSFFSQWLRLRGLPGFQVDLNKFPDFDDNLRRTLQRETELFVGSIVAEDRSVLDLLRADYTFLNERLARHYGIPHIYGDRFRRVTIADPQRGGLLGKGSILTVTSLPTRTSPVGRGKFLLESFLGAPPPSPPPDVPGLEETDDQGKPRSMREAMVQHRASPTCAACHRMMDPLGFALENFDATGAWRVRDAGVAVDASGTLPGGEEFSGPAGLRDALLANPEIFVSTFTEKLLTYALGRGQEHFDQSAIRSIVRNAATSEYRLSSLVLGMVKSVPFQMRRAAS